MSDDQGSPRDGPSEATAGPSPVVSDGDAVPPASEPDARTTTPARSSFTRWLRSTVTRPDATPRAAVPPQAPPLPTDSGRDLARHTPFSFGFFATLGGITAFALAYSIVSLKAIILLIVVSLYLALGLSPLVQWLVDRGVKRPLSVAIVVVGGLALGALGTTALTPVLTEQARVLYRNAPAYIQNLRENPQLAELDAKYHFIEKITGALTTTDWLNNAFGGLLGAGMYLANALFSIIVTLVLTIYFLASLETIKHTIYQLSPASKRSRARYIADQVFSRIGGYLTGMFIVVTIAATCAFVFLLVIGLGQYALALAFVVALFAFIPLVGSTLSMIVVSMVAFSQSTTLGIVCIVYFLVYQQFDAYVIQPRVMSQQVNVPGAVVIVAALAGGTTIGIVGAIIAIPTAAAILLLYREIVLPTLDSR